jgi:hypothetical protein
MIKNYFVTGIVVTGFVAAWIGCSGSGGGTGGGTTAAHSSSAVTSTASTGTGGKATTSSTTTGTGGSGTGGSMGVGGASANFTCMVPATPPSMGSCVTYVSVDGGEADAGLDSLGNGSITICDPITNAGCFDGDVCGLDNSEMYYDCFPGGGATVPLCGDCSADAAVCGNGLLCVGLSKTVAYCAQMCCTDADCGTGGTCDTKSFTAPLPNGVGVCH